MSTAPATGASPSPSPGRDVLVHGRDTTDLECPGPRALPEPAGLLRWGRPLLLPLSWVVRAATADRVLALTFDDGPSTRHTPYVLDALAAQGTRATFFVLAERARRNPDIVRRIAADGHEIGLHGLDHRRLTRLSLRAVTAAVRDGRRIVEDIAGQPVTLFRPPYGVMTTRQFVLVRAMGLQVVLWSAWARDWEPGNGDDVVRRALGAVHPGAVLLLHDAVPTSAPTSAPAAGPSLPGPSLPGRHRSGLHRSGPRPVDALPRGWVTARILAGLRDAEYEVVPLGELLDRYPAVRTSVLRRPRRGGSP